MSTADEADREDGYVPDIGINITSGKSPGYTRKAVAYTRCGAVTHEPRLQNALSSNLSEDRVSFYSVSGFRSSSTARKRITFRQSYAIVCKNESNKDGTRTVDRCYSNVIPCPEGESNSRHED